MFHEVGHPARLSTGSIVLAYFASAVLWIAVSDRAVAAFSSDPATIVTLSTVKGWGYVAVTGAMLALLLRRNETRRDRQTRELESSEQRFRLLAEHAQDVISRYRVVPAPGFEYMSPSVETVLGYPPSAFLADPGLMARLVHPDDRHLLEREPDVPRLEDPVVLRVEHADGHWVRLEQRSTAVLDATGALVAVEGVARDVSDRERASALLARRNRLLGSLSAANEALVRATSELDLLDSICRIVVEQGAYRYAWVGCREEDDAGSIRPVASAGYHEGDQAGLEVTWHLTERGRGPVGTSVREARTVIVRDFLTDPTVVPWREAALARGYASGAAIPLLRGGRAFGSLVVYSDERDGFGDEEITLLDQLAENLAYGLDTLRARAVHEAHDTELSRLAAAIEQTAESVVITDPGATITYVNPAFERTTGYARADVLGRNPSMLHSGVQTAAFYADMWSMLSSGATWTGELVNRRKDGTTFTEVASIAPVVGPSGAVTSYVAVKRDVTHERALEAQEVRRARERAFISNALAALRPADTATQTADAICRQILELPEIAVASLSLFEAEDRMVPVAIAVDDGRLLDLKSFGAERSRALWTRAALGPWVEELGPRAGHPYLAERRALGLLGQAYMPVKSGAALIGLLIVGSRDPDAVTLLTERLPAILEYATLAGALLSSHAAQATEAAIDRDRYRAIIDDQAFHPVFQPIVDLASGAAVGYEALTRFRDGTRPDIVFTGARRCGLEPDLEAATLRAAIAASAALPPGPFLSLNVSPSLILAGDELRAILAARTRPIVLEVTEHEIVEDYAALRAAFEALGPDLRIAVDDAGAGVANFGHLVELRPQFVKLDISLVRGVNADVTRQAMIVALLHFAGATGCRVIAEGVETEAERAVLEKVAVPLGQGYLFGRPALASTWMQPRVDASPRRRAARGTLAEERLPRRAVKTPSRAGATRQGTRDSTARR